MEEGSHKMKRCFCSEGKKKGKLRDELGGYYNRQQVKWKGPEFDHDSKRKWMQNKNIKGKQQDMTD